MPNGGYVAENGISLCTDCHLEAERWFSNDESPNEDFNSDTLYKKIESSLEVAIIASEALGS